jgi:hypothetical protein
MKKIIAISVMLVLIVGAVFADTSVGGNLKISAQLLAGKAEQDDVNAGAATIWDAYTNITWSGDNAGGMMRLWTKNNEWQPDFFTFWWWRPIDQVKLQVGKNADADFGHAQVSGWGYNAEAQGGIAVDQHRGINGTNSVYARTAAWWEGFNRLGIALFLFPVPGFEIDLAIPMESLDTAENTYLNSKINFNIGIPDIGNIRLAADLAGKDSDDNIKVNVHFGFYVMAVEGMGIDIGAAFKNTAENFDTIEAGLGYRLNADDLTLKARIGFVAKNPNDDMILGIGILPSYNLGNFALLLNAGFGMNLDKDTKDWFVNPYISVPANSGRLYAGFKLIDNGDEKIYWEIPIGWNVYF